MAGRRRYGLLEKWVKALPASGRYAFSRDEAMRALGLKHKAFNRTAGRLAAGRMIARVRGQFYVVVPLEHAATGVIPADWFIVQLLEHLKQPFYTGMLSAAEYHGAAHQRPQRYQVVTDRPLRDIVCRGVGIRFFVKKDMGKTPVQRVKGVAGYIPVSTPEATALDLIRFSRRVGGLDGVATVLQELGEALDPAKLAAAAKLDGNLAYAQRLGWLLEQNGFAAKAVRLAQWVSGQHPLPAKLVPAIPIKGSPFNQRWNLWINAEIKGDLP